MIRTINHTGRVKLPHSCIEVNLLPGDGKRPTKFRASLNLDQMEFPGNANVFVEAYYRESVKRVHFGTLTNPSPEAYEDHSIEDVYSDIPLFRVKVVDNSHKIGRLIAVCDRISPSVPENRRILRTSLLWVSFEELGQQVWKPKLTDDMPVLCINESITSSTPINEMVRTDPMFRALVFPAMIREVLQFILFDQQNIAEEDPSDWKNMWIRFASGLSVPPVPPEDLVDGMYEYDAKRWIEDVVHRFCRRHNVKSALEKTLS